MKRRHREDDLHMACVRWFDMRYPKLRELLHHSPNGGLRNEREAARFKRMGVRAGFPDLILLLPRGRCPFLGIELKTEKGRQSEYQRTYQKVFEGVGARYEVVRSVDGFMSAIDDYLHSYQQTESK